MKINKTHIFQLIIGLIYMVSCSKDKGNYNYNMPTIPQVIGLDTLYEANVGDSLIIAPKYEDINSEDLECEWYIYVPEAIDPDQYLYSGNSLRIIFGLQAKLYNARLTLTNKSTGIKYFHEFKIKGNTEFSKGTLVLSEEDGISRLSFIKPNGEVQARIYEAINLKTLPSQPQSIHYLSNKFTGNTPLAYWLIFKNEGIRIDVNNLRQEEIKPGTLRDNFFLAPENIEVAQLKKYEQGILMGVINGKFYGGITTTWDQANTYGMFGTYADGEYLLDKNFEIININNSVSILAFEKNKKQFIRFNLYGSPMYFGTQYSVLNSSIFDPTNLGSDIIHLTQVNNIDFYAYVKNTNGNIEELKFNLNFNGPFTFTPIHKRLFTNQQILNEESKIVTTKTGVFYIATENKLYRYTPLNQEIVEVEHKFTNNITMLKISEDDQTLIVGSGNTLYYLNISIGKNGNLLNKIEGIPGNTIDIAWR